MPTLLFVQQYLSEWDICKRKKLEIDIIESLTGGDAYVITACHFPKFLGRLFDNEVFQSLGKRGTEVGYIVIVYENVAIGWARYKGRAFELRFKFRENASQEMTCCII